MMNFQPYAKDNTGLTRINVWRRARPQDDTFMHIQLVSESLIVLFGMENPQMKQNIVHPSKTKRDRRKKVVQKKWNGEEIGIIFRQTTGRLGSCEHYATRINQRCPFTMFRCRRPPAWTTATNRTERTHCVVICVSNCICARTRRRSFHFQDSHVGFSWKWRRPTSTIATTITTASCY